MGCLANLAVGVNITRNRAYLSLSFSRTRRLMEVYLLALWQGPPSILKLDTNNPRLCSRSVKYIGSVLSLLTQFAFARRYHLSFPFDKGNDRYRAFYRDFARKFVTISHVMAVVFSAVTVDLSTVDTFLFLSIFLRGERVSFRWLKMSVKSSPVYIYTRVLLSSGLLVCKFFSLSLSLSIFLLRWSLAFATSCPTK